MNYNATVKSLISIYQRKWGYRQTPCLERVKRLEKQGVIMGYRALLNPELLDAPLLVIVEITLVRGKPDVSKSLMPRFKHLMKFSNVIWYQVISIIYRKHRCSSNNGGYTSRKFD